MRAAQQDFDSKNIYPNSEINKRSPLSNRNLPPSYDQSTRTSMLTSYVPCRVKDQPKKSLTPHVMAMDVNESSELESTLSKLKDPMHKSFIKNLVNVPAKVSTF